jgi:predicted  nucleic acid-binding Zn-ribbon protein
MTIDLDRFNKLKQRVNACQQRAHKAEGALERTMAQLKEEFDCDSLREGEDLLTDLRADMAKLENRYDRELKRFEQKWGTAMDEAEDDNF